jgi:hypothetical protein
MSPVARAALAFVAAVSSAEAEQAVLPSASGSGFGVRESLARHGVEVTLILQGGPSANLTGGLRQGTAMRVPLQAALDLDTERLVGWRGGRLHAGVQALEGRNASELLVGDPQGFNNVDSQRFRQVSEVWLEQRRRRRDAPRHIRLLRRARAARAAGGGRREPRTRRVRPARGVRCPMERDRAARVAGTGGEGCAARPRSGRPGADGHERRGERPLPDRQRRVARVGARDLLRRRAAVLARVQGGPPFIP